ncbi:hypothetical protein MAFF241648_21600 [Ralstonia solanacearum]|nr:hypothetical protein MAFF241648_21600 [Ralstonia solanacearum]
MNQIAAIALFGALCAPAWAGCYIYGDSIAQGVSSYLPECRADTKVGISSSAAIKKWGFDLLPGETTLVLSLGSNDTSAKSTLKVLNRILAKSKGRSVYAILPNEPTRHEALKKGLQGKAKLLTIEQVSSDDIHPTKKGYQQLAGTIRVYR